MQLTVVPFEGIEARYLTELVNTLESEGFSVSVSYFEPLPADAFHVRRQQYRADSLLKKLKKHPGTSVIGVTDCDLYRYVMKFIYGMADLPGRLALISLNRLELDSQEQRVQRFLKLSLHELGHTLGLEHCKTHACVMQFSCNLTEMDATNARYCQACEAALSEQATSLRPPERTFGRLPRELESEPS